MSFGDFGGYFEHLQLFPEGYPKFMRFSKNLKIQDFDIFDKITDRMAWHGKNNSIFKISSYLAEGWALQEPIFGLCYEFQGGSNLPGREHVKFGF